MDKDLMSKEDIIKERKRKSAQYQREYYRKKKTIGFKSQGRGKMIEEKPIDQMTPDEYKAYKRREYQRKYRANNRNHIREAQRRWERENRNPGKYRPRISDDEKKFECKHGKFVITFD